MTSDTQGGKGRGGLFGSIGRLFGGGREDDTPEHGPAADPARRDESAGPAEPSRWTGSAASVDDDDDDDDDDDEDALVLGPSLKAPGDDETGDRGQAVTPADEAEDELTLGADNRAAAGEEGDARSGGAGLAEGGDLADGGGEAADDLPEVEDFLARMRARRDEEPAGDADSENHAAALTGDSAPAGHAGSESDQGAEDLSEEDALVARLRAVGADQWSGYGGDDEKNEMPAGDSAAENAGPAEPAPAPQEGHISGFPWPSGEERDDGEGSTPASDAGPEGQEPMETEEMARDDETKTETDDPLTAGTEAPAATLFPGATAAAAEEDEREDEREAEAATGNADGAAATPPEDALTGDAVQEPDSADASGRAGDNPEEASGTAPADEADTGGDDDVVREAAIEGGPGADDAGEADRDTAQAEVVGLLAAAAADPAEPPVTPDAPDGGVLGEGGAFEESVRRVIREELEGEMGERLSRNIRKMIREEVAHALLRNR